MLVSLGFSNPITPYWRTTRCVAVSVGMQTFTAMFSASMTAIQAQLSPEQPLCARTRGREWEAGASDCRNEPL